MADLSGVLADLHAESAELDALVTDLPHERWTLETPAAGWTIAHQIAHLAWTDEIAIEAATAPDAFTDRLSAAADDADDFADTAARERVAAEQPDELLVSWRRLRTELADALLAVRPGEKITWFGPPMSPTSMATARLMETWAHGQDVADALDVRRLPSARLRHVAHLGVRTRDFAYLIRRETPPADEFRIELTGPTGELWAWGPDGAPQHVAGPALDFCLLVTQRRHRADLALVAHGADADAWLDIAQAFAGPPGPGREPR